MRIHGNRHIPDISKGIVYSNNILDIDTDTKIYLAGHLRLVVEIRLTLKIADTGTNGHNFLVGELHAEMRVDAERLAVDKTVAVAVEGEVEVEGEGGIEAFEGAD